MTARVPVRTNTDDRYFTDTFQQMPLHGYTKMFEKMLAHPNIHVMLQTDWNDIKSRVPHKRLIFTGAIDEYFGHRFGKLPYRSLRFDHRTLDQEWHQPVGTVNYPQTEDYTRISEYKHLTGQKHHRTTSPTISVGRGRPLLSDPAPGEPGAVQALREPGACDAERLVRRPARHLPVLQHGPGGGQALSTFRRIEETIRPRGGRPINAARKALEAEAQQAPRPRGVRARTIPRQQWRRGRHARAAARRSRPRGFA